MIKVVEKYYFFIEYKDASVSLTENCTKRQVMLLMGKSDRSYDPLIARYGWELQRNSLQQQILCKKTTLAKNNTCILA